MLFNSYPFIFLFLPITMLVVYLANKYSGSKLAIYCLTAASLFFYAQFRLDYIFIILFSVVFNYFCARWISSTIDENRRFATGLTIFGVCVNLAVIGFFKYYDFFIENVSLLIGADMETLRIILPIGISFFTFQQIAYLVDTYKKISHEPEFGKYTFFITFFPQLIAGPIVHHKEIMPQLEQGRFAPFKINDIALGLAIFIMGLAKKILIADIVAPHATAVFAASDVGIAPTFIEAWAGAVAFSFQIYFDFSAYSEMAIGLALLFGLRLPINFSSPYRATSMIEFWRRWHVTLSRFLRDYLYIPLGGSRVGPVQKLFNLMIVMILGGLWHGANWTFVVWGALHGGALCVNHLARVTWPKLSVSAIIMLPLMFVYLTITWVFFKAANVGSAMSILKGMAGLNGVVIPESYEGRFGPLTPFVDRITQFDFIEFGPTPLFGSNEQILIYFGLLIVVWFFPSLLSWVGYDAKPKPDNAMMGFLRKRVPFGYSFYHATLIGIIATLSVVFLYHGQVFLYFQF